MPVGVWRVAVDNVVRMSGLYEDGMSVVWDVTLRSEGVEIEVIPGVRVLKVEPTWGGEEGRNVLGGDLTMLAVVEVAMLGVEILTILVCDVVDEVG